MKGLYKAYPTGLEKISTETLMVMATSYNTSPFNHILIAEELKRRNKIKEKLK